MSFSLRESHHKAAEVAWETTCAMATHIPYSALRTQGITQVPCFGHVIKLDTCASHQRSTLKKAR